MRCQCAFVLESNVRTTIFITRVKVNELDYINVIEIQLNKIDTLGIQLLFLEKIKQNSMENSNTHLVRFLLWFELQWP